MTIRFLLALLLLAGGFTLGAGRFSGKLPGRIIEAKQLPDPVRRFVLQHFPSLNRFSYRWDKRFYYAVNENGGYLLLSAASATMCVRFPGSSWICFPGPR